jgi:hypothetical protein
VPLRIDEEDPLLISSDQSVEERALLVAFEVLCEDLHPVLLVLLAQLMRHPFAHLASEAEPFQTALDGALADVEFVSEDAHCLLWVLLHRLQQHRVVYSSRST